MSVELTSTASASAVSTSTAIVGSMSTTILTAFFGWLSSVACAACIAITES
jgi:hypothetical protein